MYCSFFRAVAPTQNTVTHGFLEWGGEESPGGADPERPLRVTFTEHINKSSFLCSVLIELSQKNDKEMSHCT